MFQSQDTVSSAVKELQIWGSLFAENLGESCELTHSKKHRPLCAICQPGNGMQHLQAGRFGVVVMLSTFTRRWPIQVSAGTQHILTKVLYGFPQSLQ